MITIRKSEERGRASFAWLNSKHTFSFGHYYDPKHMGFSALRVINDDTVAPGRGFDTHGHRDMEILSYVLSGAIEHKDSEGNTEHLPAGEFQLMSAGQGVYHSEYNASASEPLKFLQIWIEPNTKGGKPDYQQKNFGKEPGMTTILSPQGENDSLHIRQEAWMHQLILEPNSSSDFDSQAKNVYVHQVSGQLKVRQSDGHTSELAEGDGAKITEANSLHFETLGDNNSLALVFELP